MGWSFRRAREAIGAASDRVHEVAESTREAVMGAVWLGLLALAVALMALVVSARQRLT